MAISAVSLIAASFDQLRKGNLSWGQDCTTRSIKLPGNMVGERKAFWVIYLRKHKDFICYFQIAGSLQRIDSRLITEICSNVGIVRSADEMCRCLDQVVKNEIFQNSDIRPKTNKRFFSSTENYKKPHGRGVQKIEVFQNRPRMLGKQYRTVEIRKSI